MRKIPNWITGLAATVLLTACSARTARVCDAWTTKRTETIDTADRDFFANDRASRLRVEPRPLPLTEQRQEFLVTWSGESVETVKFEYRQANLPDKIQTQTIPAAAPQWHAFVIRGDAFQNSGPVTAWRISLWSGEQLVAEKKSVLW